MSSSLQLLKRHSAYRRWPFGGHVRLRTLAFWKSGPTVRSVIGEHCLRLPVEWDLSLAEVDFAEKPFEHQQRPERVRVIGTA